MKYRKLGNSGLDVSTVGLGTNNFGGRMDLESTKEVIHKFIDELDVKDKIKIELRKITPENYTGI